jgi:hypothetical protein
MKSINRTPRQVQGKVQSPVPIAIGSYRDFAKYAKRRE